MEHLDDLPKRHQSHVTDTRAEAAFQKLLASTGELHPNGQCHLIALRLPLPADRPIDRVAVELSILSPAGSQWVA
jgi:hypothetical protein